MGLRSVKNVNSFVNGHKIKGTVRTEYGGWTLVNDARPEDHLQRANLPWEQVPLPGHQCGTRRALPAKCHRAGTRSLRVAFARPLTPCRLRVWQGALRPPAAAGTTAGALNTMPAIVGVQASRGGHAPMAPHAHARTA